MKQVSDKMVREVIRIDQCSPGDNIHFSLRKPKYTTVLGELTKIKSLPKGKVQIKYRSPRFGYARSGLPSTIVHKMTVDANIMVERTRKWVASDGESAGAIPPERIEVDGIKYDFLSDFTGVPTVGYGGSLPDIGTPDHITQDMAAALLDGILTRTNLTEVLAAGLSHPITREHMQSKIAPLPVVTARQSEKLVDRILKTAEIAFSSIVLDSTTPDISPNPPISIDNLQESLNNLPKHQPGEIIALPGSDIKKS